MPSIQATSYPVSAMVPSSLPGQPAGSNSKYTAPKTDTVAPSDAGRTVSDRVTAFLTGDTTTEKTTERPKRPPPPPGGAMGPGGAGAGRSAATSESETALLLLETESDEDTETGETAGDTAASTSPILFDEAKTYYPTSIY